MWGSRKMARHKNVNWNLQGIVQNVPNDIVKIALLMDIRDELQKLDSILRQIATNTQKPRRRAKKR
jgi:hypothetical protein